MGMHRHARAEFTIEIEDEILARISDGEPLSVICGPTRRYGLPDRSSVHKYLRENQAFRQLYLVARDAQAAALAEEVVAIADGLKPDDDVPASVVRDQLRVKARQWLTSVMKPRIYEQKVDELQNVENWYEEERRMGRVA